VDKGFALDVFHRFLLLRSVFATRTGASFLRIARIKGVPLPPIGAPGNRVKAAWLTSCIFLEDMLASIYVSVKGYKT
jgi:hypothetical protein